MLGDVRLAGPRDDSALRNLARACPMSGPLSYCLEREPDFFTLTRLQGESAEVGVVDGEDAGTLDAMATSIRVVRRVGGDARFLRYLADFKVHPRARGKGLAGRLMMRACEEMARDGTPGFGIVLGGNRAMSPVVARAEADLRFLPMARLCNHSVFIAPRPRRSLAGRRTRGAVGPVVVRRAERSSVGELVALWNRLQAGRELSPVWNEQSWLDHVDATPGLGLERFWVAERRGRPVGFAAAWDASQVKQLRLLSLSRRLGWLRSSYNAATRLFGRPALPRDGDLLRFVYITHFCAETVDDFGALLMRIHDDFAGSSYLYFDLALDVRDPLARALDGFRKTRLDFDLHWITPRGLEAPEKGTGPAYFDMAFV